MAVFYGTPCTSPTEVGRLCACCARAIMILCMPQLGNAPGGTVVSDVLVDARSSRVLIAACNPIVPLWPKPRLQGKFGSISKCLIIQDRQTGTCQCRHHRSLPQPWGHTTLVTCCTRVTAKPRPVSSADRCAALLMALVRGMTDVSIGHAGVQAGAAASASSRSMTVTTPRTPSMTTRGRRRTVSAPR